MKRIKRSTISVFILGIVLMLLVLFAFLISRGPLETLEYGIYDLNSKKAKPFGFWANAEVAINAAGMAANFNAFM